MITTSLKKICVVLLILVISGGFAFAGGEQEAQRFVRFGGGSPGGSWFATVGGLSSFLSTHSGLNVTSVATGGSADTNRQARMGELDTWLTHSLTAYDLWSGEGEFEGEDEYQDFRLISGVYENHHHFVTLASRNDINSLDDLAGKSVVMGNVGSGGAINSENILSAIGVLDEIDVRYMGWDDAGRAIQDGRIDAMGASSAPLSAVVTLDAQRDIKLLSPTDEQFEMIIAEYPSYSRSVIPAGTYSSFEEDSPCISFLVFWAAQKDLADETVYEMLSIALAEENRQDVSNIHSNLETIGPYLEQMSTFAVPLHPGAVQYYDDMGYDVPESLIPPEMR